jgi:hypothetical protein
MGRRPVHATVILICEIREIGGVFCLTDVKICWTHCTGNKPAFFPPLFHCQPAGYRISCDSTLLALLSSPLSRLVTHITNRLSPYDDKAVELSRGWAVMIWKWVFFADPHSGRTIQLRLRLFQ